MGTESVFDVEREARGRRIGRDADEEGLKVNVESPMKNLRGNVAGLVPLAPPFSPVMDIHG